MAAATPPRIPAADLEGMGKKELVDAVQKIAPLSFLQEHKLNGKVDAVAKRANKDKVIAAYNELHDKGLFSTDEEREAEKMAMDLEKTKLEEEKNAAAAAKAAEAADAAPEEEEQKRYTIVVNKKGNKQNYPKKGDKVKVNYHGTLQDGTVFDSTTDEAFLKSKKRKAQPLCFKVGSNQVIRGWDECVREMSVGEKSTVTIEPEWAYGSKGVPEAGIPAKATLIFEIELVAII